MNSNLKHSDITEVIIKCFYTVYNKLGYSFLEKVYENSLLIKLKKAGLKCSPQYPIAVYYADSKVGQYFADIMVEEKIIVETKAAEALCEEHELQLISYLKATNIEVGLLLNFGKKPEIKRKIFTNELKTGERA